MSKTCYDYALHYVSRYPKTSHELQLQLRKKGYADADIETTIEELQRLAYVDDYEFTRLYLSSEVGRKGKPLYVIQQKLFQKGIVKDMIQQVIADEDMEEELITGMRNKIDREIEKLKTKGLDGIEIIQKLQGRGYAFRDIKRVIEQRETD